MHDQPQRRRTTLPQPAGDGQARLTASAADRASYRGLRRSLLPQRSGDTGSITRRAARAPMAALLIAVLAAWLCWPPGPAGAQNSAATLTLAAYSMPVEGGSGADLVVALDKPAGPDGVSVTFRVSGGTATQGTDYTIESTSVEIAPGASAAANVITPIDDAAYEGDETVILVAESPSLSLTSNTLTLTLSDNEQAPNLDREALVAFYHATNGQIWRHSVNWLSDAPLGYWEGVGVDHNGRVTELYLPDNLLIRKIPWEHLAKLTELSSLILNGNRLSGSIPPEVGSLTNLEILDLDGNRLSGSIPLELGSLTKLERLDLKGNQLTGSIPWEHLLKLTNLTGLNLEGNQLTGSIPSELGSLTNLERLELGGNRLTGSIPPELGSLTNLVDFRLQGNQLSGSIPSELGSLTSLEVLYLEDNLLTGSIPPELGSLTNLVDFRLQDNQLSGSIPPELGNLTNLRTFYLGGNRLSGCVPRSLTSASYSVRYDEGLVWCAVAPPPVLDRAALIAKMYEWRNDRCCAGDTAHTDRWDRALLAFGETVADTTLTPMTAAEAQEFADRNWNRWVQVAAALLALEAAGPQAPPNNAPTVSSAIADATIVNESGTRQVSLTGVFNDADGDPLTVSAGSSDEAKATVSVASSYASLTLSARARGTATITVTADDGNGGTVEDTFTVTVKAAPTVASAISDVTGLAAGTSQLVSLSGVFSDADGDGLSITTGSNDENVATATMSSDGASLTVTGVAAGTAMVTVTAEDSDGNRAATNFDVTVTASQPAPLESPQNQPPQNQEQSEPDSSSTPGSEAADDIVASYDTNGDGKIDRAEMAVAINDYIAGKITYAQVVEVNKAHQSS